MHVAWTKLMNTLSFVITLLRYDHEHFLTLRHSVTEGFQKSVHHVFRVVQTSHFERKAFSDFVKMYTIFKLTVYSLSTSIREYIIKYELQYQRHISHFIYKKNLGHEKKWRQWIAINVMNHTKKSESRVGQIRRHQRWGHAPWRRKHPQLTGYIRYGPYSLDRYTE